MAMGMRSAGQRDSMIGGAIDAGQGFVYSGQIEKGQMHGKGTLVYPNGELCGRIAPSLPALCLHLDSLGVARACVYVSGNNCVVVWAAVMAPPEAGPGR